MASITTIFLFFLYCWGIGFTATYLLKKPDNRWERHLLNIGIGLGIIPIIFILLNFFHIPLDWKILLALSVAFPSYILACRIQKKDFSVPKPCLRKSDLIILAVLLIFAVSFYIYAKGAFSYPYLEDEDPWGHAVGAKYVALEKNAYDPSLESSTEEIDVVLSYIDPYPPAYDILMGVLHQTSPDLRWTLKFFNALIISLGFIFFYLFAQLLMESKTKALLATAILAMIPSYLSHFIWAHSLVITIFFPFMYAFHKGLEDKKWLFIAGIITASIWVTQNFEQPIKLATLALIYVLVFSLAYRRFLWRHIAAIFSGIVISFTWWAVMINKYGLAKFLAYYGGDVINKGDTVVLSSSGSGFNPVEFIISAWQAFTNPGGTASRTYSFSDFFFAKGANMINNPIGIGIALSLLTLTGVIFLLWKYKSSIAQKENGWRSLILFWLIFTFWAVNGLNFPVSVARGAFRSWMILAIAASLVAAEGIYILKDLINSKTLKYGFLFLVLVGIMFTSGLQKYQVNTSVWPTSGSFTDSSEPFQYAAWFDTIPDNTKVFTYAPRDKLVIGFGKFSCAWCQEVIDFRRDIMDKSAEELYSFLKSNGYEYLIINGPMDYRYYSKQLPPENPDETMNLKYQEILNSGRFTITAKIGDNAAALKVN